MPCEATCMPVASSAYAAGALPAPRLRSFMAERAIHSRNRYSTARKPNLSATATGSSAMSVFVEADRGRAELDRVAGLERLRSLDAAAVDLHAVGRAEILDDPLGAARAHLGV